MFCILSPALQCIYMVLKRENHHFVTLLHKLHKSVNTKIAEVNLFEFVFRLFHEDFSLLSGEKSS